MPTALENKTAKRNRILESAYDLFLSNSFSSTAIDDVVKMAGVAKGTFYLYFKDKYNLLDEVIIRKSTEILRDAFAYTQKECDGSTPDEKILSVVTYLLDYLEYNRNFTASINKNFSRCFRLLMNSENTESSGILSSFISSFGEIGIGEDKAGIIAYMLLDMVGSVYCDALLGAGPYTPEEIRPHIIKSICCILEANKE